MKRSRAERRRQARERTGTVSARPRRRPPVGKLLAWAAGATIVGGLALVAVTGFGTGRSTVDPQTESLARANSGSEVEAITGSTHTVYHSVAPLPTRNEPRADGLPTLVWFSGTWCPFCERMEPFAHQVANSYQGQMMFVEKSVDHDRDAASRFGVRGTPTFVMLDASGQEAARFYFQGTARELDLAITQALGGAGVGAANASTLTTIQ